MGNLRLNLKTFMAIVDGHEAQLTPVEYDLLRYLMLRPGEVISAERLLQEVWRYYPGTGDTAVVRMQVMNLRDKIESDRSRHEVCPDRVPSWVHVDRLKLRQEQSPAEPSPLWRWRPPCRPTSG